MKAEPIAFSLPAHAKLNLRLEVGPISGSLHQLLSVVSSLELADELRFWPSRDGFAVRCERADLAERDNLAWQAARMLLEELPPVRIVVHKNIPMQAGLGGGSADAAAALRGLALILAQREVEITHDRLAAAALRTGSDVPALLAPGLRIVSGVGDVVTRRAASAPAWGIVLLRPSVGSSTAVAYRMLDDARVPHDLHGGSSAAEEMCVAYASADFPRFVSLLHNDFTSVIEHTLPDVAAARRRLETAGAGGTILCGSGSCVAGFFPTRAAADDALQHIALAQGEWATSTGFCGD